MKAGTIAEKLLLQTFFKTTFENMLNLSKCTELMKSPLGCSISFTLTYAALQPNFSVEYCYRSKIIVRMKFLLDVNKRQLILSNVLTVS